jgi:Microtubule binding
MNHGHIHLFPCFQVTRKRLFNSIQDMKGKIRVFCRVRPMLDFEERRGQSIAISIPDEFTAAHFWKDDKKAREYQFDQVRHVTELLEVFFSSCQVMIQAASSVQSAALPVGVWGRAISGSGLSGDQVPGAVCVRWIQRLHFCLRSNWIREDFHHLWL